MFHFRANILHIAYLYIAYIVYLYISYSLIFESIFVKKLLNSFAMFISPWIPVLSVTNLQGRGGLLILTLPISSFMMHHVILASPWNLLNFSK